MKRKRKQNRKKTETKKNKKTYGNNTKEILHNDMYTVNYKMH